MEEKDVMTEEDFIWLYMKECDGRARLNCLKQLEEYFNRLVELKDHGTIGELHEKITQEMNSTEQQIEIQKVELFKAYSQFKFKKIYEKMKAIYKP